MLSICIRVIPEKNIKHAVKIFTTFVLNEKVHINHIGLCVHQ